MMDNKILDGVISIKGRVRGKKKNRRAIFLRKTEHRPGYTIYRYVRL